MSAKPQPRMTVDEFLAWAEERPGRHELLGGEVFAMSPQRAQHARTKFAVQIALRDALRRGGRGCEVFSDGMTVRVDAATAFEPDALVSCGLRLPPDSVEVPSPVVVVHVLSPHTRAVDTGAKLTGYFEVPSVMHYLIVDPVKRLVVHHRRGADLIETRIVAAGALALDPPGLDVPLAALFDEA